MIRNSVVVALLFLGTLAICGASPYDGFKMYEIIPKTQAQCDFLYELSKNDEVYDFFTLSKLPKHPARVMISPDMENQLLKLLTEHGLSYKVLNKNVGETIEKENRIRQLKRKLSPFTGKGRLSTERYYTHDEINNYILDLAQRYPSRVFVKTVGRSYEGRSMKTITITNGDERTNKNVIFMDGGFHAREWISPAAVLYVIEQLVENFDENRELLLDYDWVILPVVNPDGYEYTQSDYRLWRKTRKPYEFLERTCYGADPNRNFDFHWNEQGASSIPCVDTYAGPYAFSEHETIVVRDLLHSITGTGRGIMYLTIHSYGNYLLYPWGWTSDLPDTWEDLDEVARAGGDAIYEATGTEYSVGSSTNVLYIAAGASDDYAFYAGFLISITMELPGGGLTGFDPPETSIDPYVKETWIGIRAMGKKIVEKYPLDEDITFLK